MKTKIRWLFVPVSVWLVLTGSGCGDGRIQERFDEARAVWYAGFADSAACQLEKMISENPDFIPAHALLQDILMHQSYRQDGVWVRYARLAAEHPGTARWQYLHARLYRGSDSLAVVSADLSRRFPDDYHCQLLWADACRQIGQYDSAFQVLDRIITRKPDEADAWMLKGKVASHIEAWKQASECYRKALRVDPMAPVALANGYSMLARQMRGDDQRADSLQSVLNSLFENYQQNAVVVDNINSVACALGRYAWARTVGDKLMELAPHGPYADNKAGLPDGNRMTSKKALAYLTQFPHGHNRSWMIGQLMHDRHFSPSRKKVFMLAWLDDEAHLEAPYFAINGAYLYRPPRQEAVAEALIRHGLAAAPSRKKAVPLFYLAKLYHECANYDSCARYARLALNWPENDKAPLNWWLGHALMKLNRPGEAIEPLAKAADSEERQAVRDLLEKALEAHEGRWVDVDAFLQSHTVEQDRISENIVLPEALLSIIDGESIRLAGKPGTLLMLHFWEPG